MLAAATADQALVARAFDGRRGEGGFDELGLFLVVAL